jgi:hypothetical protein
VEEEEGQLRGARGQSRRRRRRRSGEGEALRRRVSWEEGNRGRRGGELAGFVRAAWRGASGLVFLWIFFLSLITIFVFSFEIEMRGFPRQRERTCSIRRLQCELRLVRGS